MNWCSLLAPPRIMKLGQILPVFPLTQWRLALLAEGTAKPCALMKQDTCPDVCSSAQFLILQWPETLMARPLKVLGELDLKPIVPKPPKNEVPGAFVASSPPLRTRKN